MRRPRWNPNTVPAHVATMYAKGVGLDNEFHHAAAKALWEDGANLGEMLGHNEERSIGSGAGVVEVRALSR